MQNNPGLAPRPQAQPPRGEEQLPAFNLPPVSTTPRSKAAGPANLDQQAQARPALPLPTYSYTLPSYAPTPDATAGTGTERTVAGALAVLAGMAIFYYLSQGGNATGIIAIAFAGATAFLFVYGIAVCVRAAVERNSSGLVAGGIIVAACVVIPYLVFFGSLLQAVNKVRST